MLLLNTRNEIEEQGLSAVYDGDQSTSFIGVYAEMSTESVIAVNLRQALKRVHD